MAYPNATVQNYYNRLVRPFEFAMAPPAWHDRVQITVSKPEIPLSYVVYNPQTPSLPKFTRSCGDLASLGNNKSVPSFSSINASASSTGTASASSATVFPPTRSSFYYCRFCGFSSDVMLVYKIHTWFQVIFPQIVRAQTCVRPPSPLLQTFPLQPTLSMHHCTIKYFC